MNADKAPRSALFIELDGVLLDAVPSERPRLANGAAAVVKRMNQAGVAVVVITDQPAIGRGESSETAFAARMTQVRQALGASGANLDGCYHCSAAADHPMRKPRPGMLLMAARDLGLDLFKSWMVGTSVNDLQAAAQAGCHGAVLVSDGELPLIDLGIVINKARNLADAPRVLIPKGGGCWHPH
jgi:D-glycero-D-manno-heptose 1,7-bisphosphate phosphatase